MDQRNKRYKQINRLVCGIREIVRSRNEARISHESVIVKAGVIGTMNSLNCFLNIGYLEILPNKELKKQAKE